MNVNYLVVLSLFAFGFSCSQKHEIAKAGELTSYSVGDQLLFDFLQSEEFSLTIKSEDEIWKHLLHYSEGYNNSSEFGNLREEWKMEYRAGEFIRFEGVGRYRGLRIQKDRWGIERNVNLLGL